MGPTEPGRGNRSEPRPTAFIGAGFEYAAVVAVLAGGGWWLDGRWGTGPWLMIVGLAIGVIGETYKFYRLGKRFFR